MDSQSSEVTIEDGPLAGWDVAASHIAHGVNVHLPRPTGTPTAGTSSGPQSTAVTRRCGPR